MKIARVVPAVCFFLIACVQQTERTWTSQAPSPSPYSATLVETDYNNGESNALRVRLDMVPQGSNGWFFVEDLKTGLITSPKPEMTWSSPYDLLITVHTAEIKGLTRRRFCAYGWPSGSLTIRYVADQPTQQSTSALH